jgi:dTMP kinase
VTDPGGARLVEAAPPSGQLMPFGSTAFFRLFLAQVASSTGDWLWFLAVAITGERIGGSGFTISAALLARIAPAFFLAPLVGALVDRWDRKKVMIVCDIGRASMLLLLPLVQEPWQLVAISFGLEIFTLFWAPAKEASVPNLVPRRYLVNANSFSVGAAYGSIIPAAAIFLGLGFLADAIGDRSFLGVDITKESLAYLVDAGTFMFAVFMVWTLPLPRREIDQTAPAANISAGVVVRDVADGWRFTFTDPVVRSVNLGLATALLGGAVLVPLGLEFSTVVLGTEDGHGLLQTFFGLGAAVGVMALAWGVRHVDSDGKAQLFPIVVAIGGVLLFITASTTTLPAATFAVVFVGVAAGAMYVLGFTLLHERVSDELRGRAFGSLYTLVRLGVMTAFVLGPALSEGIDALTESHWDQQVGVFGWDVFVPGVRVTLWLASFVIVAAAVAAAVSLRSLPQHPAVEVPADEVDA